MCEDNLYGLENQIRDYVLMLTSSPIAKSQFINNQNEYSSPAPNTQDSLEKGLHRWRWLRLLQIRHNQIQIELLRCQKDLVIPCFKPEVCPIPYAPSRLCRSSELTTYLTLARQSLSVQACDPNYLYKLGKRAFWFEDQVIEYCLKYGLDEIPAKDEYVHEEFLNLHKLFWDNYIHVSSVPIMPASYYKSFFDKFFADDVYGRFESENNLILSTGSLDQDEFALSAALKYFVEFALRSNWVGYSHSLGRYSAREAICEMENAKFKANYLTRENIALTLGVTAGLSQLLRYLIKEYAYSKDDEILTHVPNYLPFIAACEEIAPTRYVDYARFPDWRLCAQDFINCVNDRTRIIFVLKDLNPTGLTLPSEEIQILDQFCSDHKIFLVVDEAGSAFLKEDNIAGQTRSPYLIRMNSLSKKWGIPGMKLGYFVADEAILKDYYEYASSNYGGPASFFYLLQEFEARFCSYLQRDISVLTEAQLKEFDPSYELDLQWLQQLYDEFKATYSYNKNKISMQRDYLVASLQRYTPTLISEIIIPTTGVNIFFKVNYPSNSYTFFRELLAKKQVAVFPGICTGTYDGCWIRVTYTIKREILIEGIKRLIEFLKDEFIKAYYYKDAVLYSILIKWGHYSDYPDIDFHAHLYDVYEKAHWLIGKLPKGVQARIDGELLRTSIFCHDAGKVISVVYNRIWRALRLSKKYPKGVPAEVVSCWRAVDIPIDLTDHEIGKNIDQDSLLKRFACLQQFQSVIDWDAECPPIDKVFTTYILRQVEYDSSTKFKWQTVSRIIAKDIKDVDFTNQISEDDIYTVLLDLADKLADADFMADSSYSEILKLLEEKKKYVLWRYVHQDEHILENAEEIQEDIEHEFQQAQKALLWIYDQ